ncbi:uncharacterized protein LOC109818772, partial [Cajanus cajan]|uniref:uncharacterized protein LOC109818772 n=1 Tax=Cajanus cajan TaxID=3821 RepID=UPI00098DC094
CVFLRIVEALGHYDDYFQMRVDATRKKGLSPLQKCTAAIRILAYGSSADSTNDYVRIGENTTVECLERFVYGVCNIFETEYLRRPKNEDVERLLQMGNARGFPGMLGPIDCMHWELKNCSFSLKVQFCRGDHGKLTIMLESRLPMYLLVLILFLLQHTYKGGHIFVIDNNTDNYNTTWWNIFENLKKVAF